MNARSTLASFSLDGQKLSQASRGASAFFKRMSPDFWPADRGRSCKRAGVTEPRDFATETGPYHYWPARGITAARGNVRARQERAASPAPDAQLRWKPACPATWPARPV